MRKQPQSGESLPKVGTGKSGESLPLSENRKKLVSPYHEVGTEKCGGEQSSPFFLHRSVMKFYNIKDDYIQFLRNYDDKVAENKNEQRPYAGVVFEINDIKYYAPFTSPKPKHQQMKNGKDFRKIDQGKLGVNFNNMIPVPDKALILKDIDNEPDRQYKRLLQNQYKAIKADKAAIQKAAENLRVLILTNDNALNTYDKQVKSRCCDLALLESIYMKYQ